MTYSGPERRQHRVYVTRNTEYHMRGRTCVRVRDRGSGDWLDGHGAVMRNVMGVVDCARGPLCFDRAEGAGPGRSLLFSAGKVQLITSPILAVERPPKALVQQAYPEQAA